MIWIKEWLLAEYFYKDLRPLRFLKEVVFRGEKVWRFRHNIFLIQKNSRYKQWEFLRKIDLNRSDQVYRLDMPFHVSFRSHSSFISLYRNRWNNNYILFIDYDFPAFLSLNWIIDWIESRHELNQIQNDLFLQKYQHL